MQYEEPFPLVAQDNALSASNMVSWMRGSVQQCESPMTAAFFSHANLQRIQQELRRSIFENTGYKINEQPMEAIGTVMRTKFLESGPYSSCNTAQEVERLNTEVLRILVPMAASGLSQLLGYYRDASTVATPLDRGTNTSIRGKNSLQLYRGF